MVNCSFLHWVKMPTVLLCVVIYWLPSKVFAEQVLRVLVPNFPPYTERVGDEISGIGIELANKVFNKANIKVSYRIVPNYAKAVYELSHGHGDAMLLASQNSERDNVAVFSKPLMINRWCWYLAAESRLDPKSPDFKANATVSSHFKTNTHKWLIANNYQVEPIMQIEILPHLLLHGRLDSVFLAELVFEQAIKERDLSLQQFKKVVEVEKPFGIYLSKTYLADNSETLTQINQAIDETTSANH